MGQKEAADDNTGNLLWIVANQFGLGFLKVFPDMVKEFFKQMFTLEPAIKKADWHLFCEGLVKKGYVDKATSDFLKTAGDLPGLISSLFTTFFPVTFYMEEYRKNVEIMGFDRLYKKLQETAPHPAPVDSLVRSMIIDPARSTENRAQLKKHGFNDTQIDNIILSHYRLYDEGTIRMCFLRKIITEEKMYERMRELGYTDTRIKEIVQTWQLLPGPGDLFNMVAKEAFEPDIYTKLGLAAEFPEEQVEWLEKQGISKAWAMKYWISHWAQPSIGQGFEMLHRGVIDLPTLDLLFRAVEVPSFWRDKLTQIAYSPFTRVDVRRMHELGVVGDKELIQAYLDIGYDSEKALKMANFTIKFNDEKQVQLTRAAILESYREGLITRKDASDLLEDQDYSPTLADYYLTLEDYKRDKEVQDMQFDNIKEQFLLGLMNEQQARSGLNKMGLLGAKIDSLITAWLLQKYKYERLPSKSDLDRFLITGIINEQEYANLLEQHGYAWRYVQMYLKELKPELIQKGRAPTMAELTKWVKNKTITKEQWRLEVKAQGYDDKYIAYYEKNL